MYTVHTRVESASRYGQMRVSYVYISIRTKWSTVLGDTHAKSPREKKRVCVHVRPRGVLTLANKSTQLRGAVVERNLAKAGSLQGASRRTSFHKVATPCTVGGDR